MIEAVYFGTLIPLLFLVIVIKGEHRNLILFFTWGLTSAIIVYLINLLIDRYFLLDQTIFLTQIIPVMEELIKIFPLLFLVKGRRKIGKSSIVIYAMASGIGFSILENYLYLTISASSGLGDSLLFIITRSLTACLLHGTMTALIGYSIQLMRNRGFFSYGLLAGLFLFSASIHSLYNILGLTDGWQVYGILIPLLMFMAEYYLLNLFGRKRGT
ncbi:MAG: PrsW family intramembrane metalloprotease [Spirochaetales bacterium]|nr:PrsW family intramembrane metalloprotease [Spirochaetales bacterium]